MIIYAIKMWSIEMIWLKIVIKELTEAGFLKLQERIILNLFCLQFLNNQKKSEINDHSAA